MIRQVVCVVTVAWIVLDAGTVAAQSRVPSVYDPDCKGLICANDSRTQAGPPPPCQGLICGLTPYSMQPPMTASEAQRLQAQRAEAEAAAAAAAPPPDKPTRKPRHAKGRSKAKTVATRTPDPSSVPAAPAPK